MLAVKAFRSQLSHLNVAKNANPEIYLRCRSADLKEALAKEVHVIQSLVKSGLVTVLGQEDADPAGSLKNHVNEDIQTYTKVVGLIDIKLEIDRLRKRQKELEKYMDDLKKKTTIPNYETKVPENVKQENAKKMAGYEGEHGENQKSQDEMAQFL